MNNTKAPLAPLASAASKKLKKDVAENNKEPKQSKKINGKLALVLVRGLVRIRTEIVATLYTLRLRQNHACVVVDDIPSNRAAAVKCKDYLTYGEINDETYKLLIEKRGKKDKDGKLKKYFLLHPPRGGFERKGIKTPFTTGGALGYRGDKINDLIKRML